MSKLPLRTTGRVNYPKDYSLSRSIGEVFDNTNEVSNLNLTNDLNNIHTENFRLIEDTRGYVNQAGIHFAEVIIPPRFLIKFIQITTSYSGDFAVEFVSGSDILTLNGVTIQERNGLDGTDYYEELNDSITKEENTLRVEALAVGAASDSTMSVLVRGFQL